jgi:hypothetical protein
MAKNHWKYEGRPRYNPDKEGYGNPRQWNAAFYARMGWEEAQKVRAEAQSNGTWKPEHQILSDESGVPLYTSSVWSEVKTAFRKACLNTHPDRTKEHGIPEKEAEERFKKVSAAYAILAKQYGE